MPDTLCVLAILSISGFQFPSIDTGRIPSCWVSATSLPDIPEMGAAWGMGGGPDQTWPPIAQNQLDTQRPLVTESVKRAVVSAARDTWEVYFSRLFPATVRVPHLPPTCPEDSGMRREDPHMPFISAPGQCGHWCAAPSCVPRGHQTPEDGQRWPGGRRAAAGPACIQVTGRGWLETGVQTGISISFLSTATYQVPMMCQALCQAIEANPF